MKPCLEDFTGVKQNLWVTWWADKMFLILQITGLLCFCSIPWGLGPETLTREEKEWKEDRHRGTSAEERGLVECVHSDGATLSNLATQILCVLVTYSTESGCI